MDPENQQDGLASKQRGAQMRQEAVAEAARARKSEKPREVTNMTPVEFRGRVPGNGEIGGVYFVLTPETANKPGRACGRYKGAKAAGLAAESCERVFRASGKPRSQEAAIEEAIA
eukprot:15000510-Alexandrium_andersonii.AAC.1